MTIQEKEAMPENSENMENVIKDEVEEAEINEINKAWPGLMQETFKQKADTIKIKPISLKNKILFVNCQNSVWANELQAHQTEIIKKINQQIGRESLIKVRIIY